MWDSISRKVFWFTILGHQKNHDLWGFVHPSPELFNGFPPPKLPPPPEKSIYLCFSLDSSPENSNNKNQKYIIFCSIEKEQKNQ